MIKNEIKKKKKKRKYCTSEFNQNALAKNNLKM